MGVDFELICPNCKKIITSDQTFCQYCGFKLHNFPKQERVDGKPQFSKIESVFSDDSDRYDDQIKTNFPLSKRSCFFGLSSFLIGTIFNIIGWVHYINLVIPSYNLTIFENYLLILIIIHIFGTILGIVAKIYQKKLFFSELNNIYEKIGGIFGIIGIILNSSTIIILFMYFNRI